MNCRQCGIEVPLGKKFCRNCGAPVAVEAAAAAPAGVDQVMIQSVTVCPSCQKEVALGKRFCRYCGASVAGGEAQGPGTSIPKPEVSSGFPEVFRGAPDTGVQPVIGGEPSASSGENPEDSFTAIPDGTNGKSGENEPVAGSTEEEQTPWWNSPDAEETSPRATSEQPDDVSSGDSYAAFGPNPGGESAAPSPSGGAPRWMLTVLLPAGLVVTVLAVAWFVYSARRANPTITASQTDLTNGAPDPAPTGNQPPVAAMPASPVASGPVNPQPVPEAQYPSEKPGPAIAAQPNTAPSRRPDMGSSRPEVKTSLNVAPPPPVPAVPAPRPQPTYELSRSISSPPARASNEPSNVTDSAPPPPPRVPSPEPTSAPRPMAQSGYIVWNGAVQKNGIIEIDGDTSTPGNIQSGLPGVPVTIDLDTKNYALVEYPSASNGYRRMKIRSRNKESSIILKWQLAK